MTDKNLPRPNKRQQIWDKIRTFKKAEFKRTDLLLSLELTSKEFDNKFLRALIIHGFLKVVCDEPKTYVLNKDNGIEAPRFTNSGDLITTSGVNESIWRTMRIMKQFTVPELTALVAETTQVSGYTVSKYVTTLKKAGYVVVIGQVTAMIYGQRDVLSLIKNTGPKPPQILRIKELFDPNTNQIVYREVPESEQ